MADLKGGVLVPSPDVVLTLTVDPEGGLSLTLPWPDGLPSQVSLWWQVWIPDVGGHEAHLDDSLWPTIAVRCRCPCRT